MTRQPDHLNVAAKGFTIHVAYDGTTTVAHAVTTDPWGGEAITATGTARRKKGDPRNKELGFSIATARVFRQLAEREEEYVDSVLNPKPSEEEPSLDVLPLGLGDILKVYRPEDAE